MEKRNKAFTLVELIVVITILAILGTIAFLSLQGYSANARDSVRVSDIKNIEKGLGVMLVKSGIVPTPDDNKITITASGTTIGYQGYAGKLVQSQLGMSKDSGKDPTDGTYYTYSTNASKTKYEIVGFLEGGLSKNEIIGNSYAATDYSQRTIMLKGDDLGILLSNTGTTLNQPAQENGSISLDLTKTTTGSGYIVQFNNLETSTSILGASSTGTLYSTVYNKRDDLLINKTLASFDDSLVGYWDMESTIMTGGYLSIKDLSKNGNHLACQDGNAVSSWITKDCGTFGDLQFTSTNKGKGLTFNGGGSRITSYIQTYGFPTGNNSITFLGYLKIGDFNKYSFENGGYYANVGYFGSNVLGMPHFFISKTGKITQAFNFCDATQISGDTVNTTDLKLVGWTYNKNDSQIRFYINGSIQDIKNGSGTGSCPIPNLQNGWVVFGNDSLDRRFNGLLDEARIYNRALSDSEIQSLYNATK